MKNLNVKQIKKALECCADRNMRCDSCPYMHADTEDDESCAEIMEKDALDLITSQEQRIKELAEKVESLGAEKEHLDLVVEGKLKRTTALEKQVLKLTEENERLKTAIPLWAKQCVELEERCMQLRADTVRKMQELVRKKIKKTDWLNGRAVYVEIDKTAKEVLEGKNEIKTNSEHS